MVKKSIDRKDLKLDSCNLVSLTIKVRLKPPSTFKLRVLIWTTNGKKTGIKQNCSRVSCRVIEKGVHLVFLSALFENNIFTFQSPEIIYKG